MGRLDRYNAKRDFAVTPEPDDPGSNTQSALRYAMQKHDATRLHWDLRLEWEGVLLSWAVTRGPALDPGEKRLAVQTEDHPLSYLEFEGTIPAGNYGAGTVMLWDLGHWQPLDDAEQGLKKGHLRFRLHGARMTGGWHLIRMKARRKGDTGRQNWLLMKDDDAAAHRRDPVRRYLRSVASDRTMAAIAAGKPAVDRPRALPAPKYRKPQLATLSGDLPQGKDWWHELKFDGYRALVSLGKGGPRIFTRNGHDWTDRFAPLLPALREVTCDSALLDTEIIAGAGLQGFGALQKAIKSGGPFALHAFDLLSLDGADLTAKPLTERRDLLEKAFAQGPPLGQAQLSPIIEADAQEAFETVCAAGGEGLIAKRSGAAYRGARTTAWLKIKCERRDDFRIIGWQESSARGRPFSSLLLAEERGGALHYVGKVGTGFDAETMDMLADRVAPLRRDTAPAEVPRSEARGAVWVRPALRAEIAYAEVTDTDRLRHAVFHGLREDLEPQMPEQSPPENTAENPSERTPVAGVPISSPDRVIYPGEGITKLDVARYYEAVAERLLETAADRPLSLVRLPTGLEGERFFQKHAGKGFPDGLKPVEIGESDGGSATYMYIDDAAGLVGGTQMGALEYHVWGARRDRLDRPDRMVFDLDPDEGLAFKEVRDAAIFLRGELDTLGLQSWPLLTGGKGVHVVVPLRRTASWETMTLFSRTFAHWLADAHRDRFTANLSKARRKGRIFIDWLRNQRGSTAIAPFSLRAHPGAPVAVPVSWDELSKSRRADGFTMRDVLDEPDRRIPRTAPGTLGKSVLDRLEAKIEA